MFKHGVMVLMFGFLFGCSNIYTDVSYIDKEIEMHMRKLESGELGTYQANLPDKDYLIRVFFSHGDKNHDMYQLWFDIVTRTKNEKIPVTISSIELDSELINLNKKKQIVTNIKVVEGEVYAGIEMLLSEDALLTDERLKGYIGENGKIRVTVHFELDGKNYEKTFYFERIEEKKAAPIH